MRFVSGALVFDIERSAITLACEQIDQWMARANAELS